MPVTALSNIAALVVVAALVIYYALWIVHARTLHPLAKHPGPFLASFSRAWLAWHVWRGDLGRLELELHARHGRFVRIAPDQVSISDPSALKAIYDSNSGFTKTDFYLAFRPNFYRAPDLFTELNDESHAKRRRIWNHLYTMTNMTRGEQYIENCVSVFMDKMKRNAENGESFNLALWVHWYVFDVIGELYFSRMFGFLEREEDHGSWIAALHVLAPALNSIACMPKYARTLLLVSSLAVPGALSGLRAMGTLSAAAGTCIQQRRQEIHDGKDIRSDLLQQMMHIEKEKGEKLDFQMTDIKVEIVVALFAGTETILFAISAAFYELLKAPRILAKLQNELDDATKEGKLGHSVGYLEASSLPYLSACIKETLRLHPSVTMPIPRKVPSGGRTICGEYFPEGACVGVNAAVMHRDKACFGADADTFNPERWFRPQAQQMDRHIFTWGGGARTCIGKHIALCEMYKLIPRFLRDYEVTLQQDKSWTWTTRQHWISRPDELMVKIKARSV